MDTFTVHEVLIKRKFDVHLEALGNVCLSYPSKQSFLPLTTTIEFDE